MFENLVFGRSGLNLSVFEKLYISYSCILFIKQCVLRSFCIKNAMFFKKLLFLDFRLIEPVAQPIENVTKIRFESAWLDRFLIGVGSIQCDFRSIKSIFLTDRKSVKRCFKRLFSHAHHTVHTFSKAFSLSFLDRSTSNQFFVVFFLIFLKGFCLQVLVRPYYPFFFILFTFFMHFRCNF